LPEFIGFVGFLGEQGVFAVAGPGVFVQFFEVSHYPRSQRVQMDVADQFQEIRIFLAHDGFVSVLKKAFNPTGHHML
jgi:hypothetical protein